MTDSIQCNASKWTISRRLKERGIAARVAAKKDFLKPQHLESRLNFAQQYADFPVQWWNDVIFSDETTFG